MLSAARDRPSRHASREFSEIGKTRGSRKREKPIDFYAAPCLRMFAARAVCVSYPCTTRGGKLVQWNLEYRGRRKYRRNQRLRSLPNAVDTPFGLMFSRRPSPTVFRKFPADFSSLRARHLPAARSSCPPGSTKTILFAYFFVLNLNTLTAARILRGLLMAPTQIFYYAMHIMMKYYSQHIRWAV